jgi:predicted ATPase
MIHSIRIQNFRSIVDQTVHLDPLTVLIGRSGTGKSNFVDALRFLRECLAKRQVDFEARGGIARVLHIGNTNEKLAFTIEFAVTGLESAFRYFVSWSPKQKLEEWFEADGNRLYHTRSGSWVKSPPVVPMPHPHDIVLGAIPGLQESSFAYVALRSGLGCYDFPGSVIAAESQPGFSASSDFSDNGSNYLAVANRILSDLTKAQHWKRIAKSLRAVNRRVANLTLNVPQADRIYVALKVGERLMTFDVREESEGFRRYLAHMLALYQTPSKQTLVFEHPESGLHPGALEALAEELRDTPTEGRGQVILTTHSPQLLDYFPATAIRVVEMEGQATRIDRLAPEQLEAVKDRLLQPGELLTVDPARVPELSGAPG